jgi:hypothetical protein
MVSNLAQTFVGGSLTKKENSHSGSAGSKRPQPSSDGSTPSEPLKKKPRVSKTVPGCSKFSIKNILSPHIRNSHLKDRDGNGKASPLNDSVLVDPKPPGNAHVYPYSTSSAALPGGRSTLNNLQVPLSHPSQSNMQFEDGILSRNDTVGNLDLANAKLDDEDNLSLSSDTPGSPDLANAILEEDDSDLLLDDDFDGTSQDLANVDIFRSGSGTLGSPDLTNAMLEDEECVSYHDVSGTAVLKILGSTLLTYLTIG